MASPTPWNWAAQVHKDNLPAEEIFSEVLKKNSKEWLSMGALWGQFSLANPISAKHIYQNYRSSPAVISKIYNRDKSMLKGQGKKKWM